MGAVEHLKTLCCLGLPPESAMVADVPVPHLTEAYAENPFRERLWRFMDDPSAPASL